MVPASSKEDDDLARALKLSVQGSKEEEEMAKAMDASVLSVSSLDPSGWDNPTPLEQVAPLLRIREPDQSVPLIPFI